MEKKILLFVMLIGITYCLKAQDQSINGATFKQNGKVGIGTTNPSSELEVKSAANDDSEIHINAGTDGGKSIIRFQDAGQETWGFLSNYPTNGKFSLYNYHNNTNSLVIDQNGKVGIGTTNPSSELEVKSAANDNSEIHINAGTDGGKSIIRFQDAGQETWGLLSNYPTNGKFSLYNYHNNTNSLVIDQNGNTGIGTTNPGIWKLAVNGQIRAKEIKVETGWSDFVFYDDYKLPTLKQVENHIKEKGHLKNIPSAKEVKENGIYLGEMDSKLLQKIEELTLYTIQQQKEIEELKSQNKKLLELQSRLEKLESEK